MTEKRRKPTPWWTQRPSGETENSIPHRDLSRDPTALAEAEASWKRHFERTTTRKRKGSSR
jgi:hypothetical protein